MDTLSQRLRSEAKELSWNRKPEILIEAADEWDKLQNQIKDNAIIHVRETNKLRKKIKSLSNNSDDGEEHF